MSELLLFGVATIVLGIALLWLGAIFQMSEKIATADDARVLLGIGTGMVLAGCGFCFMTGWLYPDMAFEAKRQAAMVAIEQAHPSRQVAAIP